MGVGGELTIFVNVLVGKVLLILPDGVQDVAKHAAIARTAGVMGGRLGGAAEVVVVLMAVSASASAPVFCPETVVSAWRAQIR